MKNYEYRRYLSYSILVFVLLFCLLGCHSQIKNEIMNPHLPKNKALHTFLLDENNNVILVGNPLHNKKIEKIFYKIVEEKLGKPQ